MAAQKFKVVVTDQVFPDVEVEREILTAAGADLVVASGGREEVLALARAADGLLNTYFPLDAAALAQLTRCRIVARYGIGVDNIDLDVARSAGIVVTNVPDYCVEEVATHALTLLLSLIRKVPQADTAVRSGEWGIAGLRPLYRLSEMTIGLVGYGRIGRLLAKPLQTLGARVVVHDPYLSDEIEFANLPLAELLSTADAVSLHSPLTPQTRGMIDSKALDLMQPHAVLVNTSRGPLVVLDDLLTALREGRIAGAALDVFETEPPDPQHFSGVPNLLLTPHSAFYSEAAVRESQRKAATQIVKVLTGAEPDYRVNS